MNDVSFICTHFLFCEDGTGFVGFNYQLFFYFLSPTLDSIRREVGVLRCSVH